MVIGKGKLIGEHQLEEFLAEGITVWVENSDHLRLANCIDELGLHYRFVANNSSHLYTSLGLTGLFTLGVAGE